MFRKSIFYVAVACMALSFNACKDDSEDDLNNNGGDSVSGLYINEVVSSGTDWVELYNSTDAAIDLSGYILQDDKGSAEEAILAEGTTIEAKGFLVLSNGTDFSFGISGTNGDQIALFDATGEPIDNIDVPSLDDSSSYARTSDGGDSWAITANITKGFTNTGTMPTTEIELYINEIMAAGADDEADFIELYNAGDSEVDLEGFVLSDSGASFTIPAGVSIAAKGFLTFTQDEADSFTFGLSSKGELVTLVDGDGAEVDKVDFPTFGDVKGQSYARIGDGGSEWQIVDEPTKNAANASEALTTLLGKIVINEVYTFGDQSTKEDLDWIELYNSTDAAIDLSGLKLWEGGGRGEAWEIPAGTTIAAGGLLVIESDKDGLYADPTKYPAWGLSKGPSEYIVLARGNMAVLDSIALPSMNANESYGRKTDGASDWQIFAQFTKGTTNEGDARVEIENTVGIYVNEVYTDNSDATGITSWDATIDFIELYNATDAAIDISGWYIYDDKATIGDGAYQIPAGTSVPAKGFLTYNVDKNITDGSGPTFGLGVSGDWVNLHNGTEIVDQMEIPGLTKAADATDGIGERDFGYTYGRITDGGSTLGWFTEASKNASNNGKALLEVD